MSWEAGAQSMEVTSESEAGGGAKPADELVEGLALTVEVTGRPVEGEALSSVMGGGLREEAGESTDTWVGDSVLEVLGATGKAKVTSAAAETQALGCKGPPPTASPPPLPIQRGFPDGLQHEGARGCCSSSRSRPARSWASACTVPAWCGRGACSRRGAAVCACVMASISPPSALLMCWNGASFLASGSFAVTRKASSGGVGSLRGSPGLRRRRHTLCFGGLGLSRVGE